MMLVGDYCPGSYAVRVNINGNPILANLEGPILLQNHSNTAVLKAGPSLYSSNLPEKSSNYIFTLANNHTMDFGKPGLDTTINILQQKGIRFCGAGNNVSSARKPLIIHERGISLGIISCCEAQFGVGRSHQPGVAEFDPWIYQEIRNLADQVDGVIVSIHAGIEDLHWPSPFIRDLYRSFIDAGATIIHSHHAHVPQGYEEYHNGLIFYGMGNYAVDPVKWRDYQNGLWSIGADIDLYSKPLHWELKTFEIRHESGSESITIEESLPEEREYHMKYLEYCNRPLYEDILFDSLWQEVAIRAFYRYGGHYMDFLPPNSFGGIIKKLAQNIKSYAYGNMTRFNTIPEITQQKQLLYYVMLACESHRQMLTTALGVLSGEIKDLRTEESRQLAEEMLYF